MNLKRVLLPAVALSVPLALIWSSFGSTAAQDKKLEPARPATKWEYKVIRSEPGKDGREIDWDKMQQALNKLGEEGWECVGPMGELAGSEQQSYWTKAVLVCKRPKP